MDHFFYRVFIGTVCIGPMFFGPMLIGLPYEIWSKRYPKDRVSLATAWYYGFAFICCSILITAILYGLGSLFV